MNERLRRTISWAKRTTIARVVRRFTAANGPLVAAGMTYHSLFALFAVLWITFSVLGLVAANDDRIWNVTVHFIERSFPLLIDTGTESAGVVPVDTLRDTTSVLSWTGAAALVGLSVTITAWLRAVRTAIRSLFGMPKATRPFVVAFALDLLVAGALSMVMVISATLSVGAMGFAAWIVQTLGFSGDSAATRLAVGVTGVVVSFILDLGTIIALVRGVARVRVPWAALWQGAGLGALGLAALKFAGTSFFGGETTNPLLVSFAVLIGLLFWLLMTSYILVISAAWIAESSERLDSRNGA